MIVPETEHKQLSDILNFENAMGTEERVTIAQSLMYNHIFPWIAKMSSRDFVINDARNTQSNLSQRDYFLGVRFRDLIGES